MSGEDVLFPRVFTVAGGGSTNLGNRSDEGAFSVALGLSGPVLYHPAALKPRSCADRARGNPSVWYVAGKYLRRIDLVDRTVHTEVMMPLSITAFAIDADADIWLTLHDPQQNTCYLYIVTQAEEVPQEVRQLPHPVNVAASTQFNSAKNRKAYRFIGAAGVTSDGKADQGGFGFVYSLIVNSLGVGYVGECGRIRVVEKSTQTVTTIVGALNSAGFTDEVGIKARIGSHPFLTFFPEENSNDASHGSGAPQIAIADYTNCAVRVLDPETGAVTTLAGSGTSVHKDGKAKAASFLYPLSIVSSQGYLYVVDASHTIRRISQLGDVVTLCGNPGAAGFSDNKGTSALLNTQTSTNCSITADPNTNTVYFYDTGNARMRAFVDPNLVLGAGSSSEAAAVASAGAVGSGGTSVSNACAGLGLPHDLAQDMREVLADADSCDVAFTGNESSRAPPTSKSSTSPLSSAVLMRSVGGFRRILSARSPYFRAMFDGNMHSRRSAATLPPPTTTAASAGAYAAVASSGTAAVHHDQVETIQLPYPLPVISAAIYFLHTDVLDLHWHEAKDHEEGKGGPGPAADLETKEASSAASSSNSFSSSSSSSSSSSASAASGAAAGRVGCSSSAAYDSASAGDFDVLLQLLGVAEAWHLPRLKQLVQHRVSTLIAPGNVCSMLVAADRFKCAPLRAYAIKYILAHIARVRKITTPGQGLDVLDKGLLIELMRQWSL